MQMPLASTSRKTITTFCLIFITLLCWNTPTLGQELQLLDFNQSRLQINKQSLSILGAWAVGNIAFSTLQYNRTKDSRKHFHEMNIGWNTINLLLAGTGIWTAMHTDPANFDLAQTLKAHHSIKSLLIFNAGLDIGYMATGLFLLERGRRPEANALRWKGWGQSLILQGGFLFVFDLLFFTAHQFEKKKLYQLIDQISFNGNSLGINVYF